MEARPVKVLVVDDETGFRETLARRLARRGVDVAEAGGGQEALELLKSRPAEVVVLDVKMPGLSGLEVLREIKADHPKTEVILVTGQASTIDGVEGIKRGAFDYLSKPLEFEHLLSKIGQARDKILWAEEQAREAEFRARMEQRMAAAERLASLGTLATGVAHEINNPLAIIAEAAGWLKSKTEKEDGLRPDFRQALDLALGKIDKSVERAKRITTQLLGLARKEEPLVREFDLRDVVAEVVELTRKIAAESGSELSVRNVARLTAVWSDPHQVRQILINLVNNAVQAAGEKGEVVIEINGDEREAVVGVRDNGPGIPPENLDRIFEPFFTTKPPGRGTGLGLSVSRSLSERLGGRIEVESVLGAGAAFRLALPRHPPGRPGAGAE